MFEVPATPSREWVVEPPTAQVILEMHLRDPSELSYTDRKFRRWHERIVPLASAWLCGFQEALDQGVAERPTGPAYSVEECPDLWGGAALAASTLTRASFPSVWGGTMDYRGPRPPEPSQSWWDRMMGPMPDFSDPVTKWLPPGTPGPEGWVSMPTTQTGVMWRMPEPERTRLRDERDRLSMEWRHRRDELLARWQDEWECKNGGPFVSRLQWTAPRLAALRCFQAGIRMGLTPSGAARYVNAGRAVARRSLGLGARGPASAQMRRV